MADGQKRMLLILLASLFLYLSIGAAIFWKLEEGEDTTEILIHELYDESDVNNGNFTYKDFRALMVKAKHVFEISHFGETTWNFYTSLYFCGSVVTTIGE